MKVLLPGSSEAFQWSWKFRSRSSKQWRCNIIPRCPSTVNVRPDQTAFSRKHEWLLLLVFKTHDPDNRNVKCATVSSAHVLVNHSFDLLITCLSVILGSIKLFVHTSQAYSRFVLSELRVPWTYCDLQQLVQELVCVDVACLIRPYKEICFAHSLPPAA